MKRVITDCILVILFFFVMLALVGCAKNPPVSETIADNAVNATTGLEQSLPAECKTDAIMTQITVVKTQIRAISSACETEKDVITTEKLRWMWSFWGVVGLVGIFLVRKILK